MIARNIHAIALVAVAACGLLALPPALAWSTRARSREAAMIAITGVRIAAPTPLLPTGAAFAGDERQGDAALRAICRSIPAREGALVERSDELPPPAPGIVARRIVVSGGARTMLRLISTIERHVPVLRMPRYRLATDASGQSLRLDADVAMAWSPR